MEKATRQSTKEHNRNLVLKNVFEHETISRAEIARITHLTPTTVSDIVATLIEEGLVAEIGVGPSYGGKSPILLSLQENSRVLIGLDLAHNQFCGALVNLRGKIHQAISLPVDERSGDGALSLVYTILDRLIASASQPLLGIGVGTPGLVNTREGVVIHAVNLNWTDLPLTHLLEERYHIPVSVLNDSQAAAVGEYTYGKDHHSDENLVVINARHGLGAGLILHGTLFQGSGGSAGEIGHTVVIPEGGLPCRCGKHGCLETVASAQALIIQARAQAALHPTTQLPHDPEKMNLEVIEEAFAAGDPLAQQLVLATARFLGVAIANLVGVLNIEKIVLSGDMTRFGEPWLNMIREVMLKSSLTESAHGTQVEIGELGESSILLGASAILVKDYSLLFKDQPLDGERAIQMGRY
jgi:glucokinase-like ROK family protein